MSGWSREACLVALRDCVDDLGRSPSGADYRDWREGRLRPSQEAIKRCFGSWNAAKDAAGLRVYGRGPLEEGST